MTFIYIWDGRQSGTKAKDLARQYGLCTAAIYNISSGKSWRHLSLNQKRGERQ